MEKNFTLDPSRRTIVKHSKKVRKLYRESELYIDITNKPFGGGFMRIKAYHL